MPGLEAAMGEFGSELSEREEIEASATPKADKTEIDDAKPRTLYVHRKVLNAADIVAWAKAQGFDATLPAADMHVTIAFSRTPVDWMKAGADWAGDENGKIKVVPGGARIIEKFDGGAVVLLFNSSQLAYRHECIKEAGASWDWPEYQPHITITYNAGDVDLSKVEPYRGAIELGPEVFEELDTEWREKINEVTT